MSEENKQDRHSPFSNGTQWMDWESSNCGRCSKSGLDADGWAPKCEPLNALFTAQMGDGSIDTPTATDIGFLKEDGTENGNYIWMCASVDWSPEWIAEHTRRQDRAALEIVVANQAVEIQVLRCKACTAGTCENVVHALWANPSVDRAHVAKVAQVYRQYEAYILIGRELETAEIVRGIVGNDEYEELIDEATEKMRQVPFEPLARKVA